MSPKVAKHLKNFKANHTTPSFFIKVALIALLLLFIIVPVFSILTNVTPQDAAKLVSSPKFGYSILYSLLYSIIGATISVILAVFAAFLLSRSNFKGKRAFSILLTLPMLIPTLSIGLGIRNLFGSANLGVGALIVGASITGFPIAFLLIYDSLQYEDKTIYDAAMSLGIRKRKSFFNVTLPYLKRPIISAFIATAVWVFTDYGLPLEVAGNIPTIPTTLYETALLNFEYGKASIIALVLIIPSLGSFIFSQLSKESATETPKEQVIQPTRTFNVTSIVLLSVISAIVLLPQIIFLIIAFVKRFPVDMTFTLEHFSNAFNINANTNVWKLMGNSILMSFLTAAFGTFFAYICAYFSVRSKGFLSKLLDILSLISMAIPGLVLGLGFVIVFNFSNGWFYGTLAILVVANCVHFFSSPYLLAKNALNKLDKDYETIGQTLNASKAKMLWEVIIPNSFSTIIEMFSYFFINSMITISAISFLVQYYNIPLAIDIVVFGTSDNYAMQSVISIVILVINVIVKIGLEGLSKLVQKKTFRADDSSIALSHNEFRVLNQIKINEATPLTKKEIIKKVKQPASVVNKILNDFVMEKILEINDKKQYVITQHGTLMIEPYRVRKAIIIAAGFGSRMVPVTLDTPKPLVKVNGTRIIDTLLDALYAQDIKNIYIIRGYLGEQFDQLLTKYPTIKFIDNDMYNSANNISSVYMAREYLDRCYICEADLVISNPKIITKYQFRTNYLGIPVKETDDWCFHMAPNGRYIESVAVGGQDCIQMVGISYWTSKDAAKLRTDVEKVYLSHGGKENYWDNVPLVIKKKNYQISIRKCEKKDVLEIDNFSELVAIDKSYKNYVAKNKN